MDARPDKPAEESSPASASPPLPQSSANGPATADIPTTEDGSISPDVESQQIKDYLKVNLLRDDPVETGDVGDAHERIADSITELIRTEKRGAAIALEGPYGSGKSTIVKMIEKRLRAEDEREPKQREYHVFTFDAWHHENEALRLAFLHGLLESLENYGWIAKERANSLRIDLGKLDGSNRETTTTRKLFSSWRQGVGVLCITVALVLSAAHEVVAPMVNWIGQIFTKQKFDDGTFYLGLFGIMLVLGGAVLLICEACVRLKEQLRQRTTTVQSKVATESLKKLDYVRLFIESFFTGMNTTGEQTVVKGDGEVSSRDFESHFRLLLDAAMTNSQTTTIVRSDCSSLKGTERFVVVVIDNLDRLDQSQVTEVWGTLKVFIEEISHRRDDSADSPRCRVWHLVPFDRDRLFGKEAATDDKQDERCLKIDKIFPVRYDVSTVQLVQWHNLLRNLLRRSLEHWSSDYREAINVIDLYYQSLQRPPTFRELIMIVNDMGALIKTCGPNALTYDNREYFQLRTFAAFVALRRRGHSISDIRKMMSNQDPVPWLSVDVNAKRNILIGISCIAMGTTNPIEAQEQELSKSFATALSNGDISVLRFLVFMPYLGNWLYSRTHSLYTKDHCFDVWRSIDVLLNDLDLVKTAGDPIRTELRSLVTHLLTVPKRLRSDHMKSAALAAFDLFDKRKADVIECAALHCSNEYRDKDLDTVVEIVRHAQVKGVIWSQTRYSVEENAIAFARLCYRLYTADDRHRSILHTLVSRNDESLNLEALFGTAISMPDPVAAIKALRVCAVWNTIEGDVETSLFNRVIADQNVQPSLSIEYRLGILRKLLALRQVALFKKTADERILKLIHRDQYTGVVDQIKRTEFNENTGDFYIESLAFLCEKADVHPVAVPKEDHTPLTDWLPLSMLVDSDWKEWRERLFQYVHPMSLDGRLSEALIKVAFAAKPNHEFANAPLLRWIELDAPNSYQNRKMDREVFIRCQPFLQRLRDNPKLAEWVETLFKAHAPADSASLSTSPLQPTEPPKTGP